MVAVIFAWLVGLKPNMDATAMNKTIINMLFFLCVFFGVERGNKEATKG